MREDSGYRIGRKYQSCLDSSACSKELTFLWSVVFGNTSIDGKACGVDMSCSAPFTIMDGTDKSDCDE